jgi:hypothetical protein
VVVDDVDDLDLAGVVVNCPLGGVDLPQHVGAGARSGVWRSSALPGSATTNPGGPAPARSSPPTGPRPAVPVGRGDTGSCATSRVRPDVDELLGHDHVLDIRPHPAAATSMAGGLAVMG